MNGLIYLQMNINVTANEKAALQLKNAKDQINTWNWKRKLKILFFSVSTSTWNSFGAWLLFCKNHESCYFVETMPTGSLKLTTTPTWSSRTSATCSSPTTLHSPSTLVASSSPMSSKLILSPPHQWAGSCVNYVSSLSRSHSGSLW